MNYVLINIIDILLFNPWNNLATGTVYNGLEYLHIEVDVNAVHRQEQLATASFCVYHDPNTLEEKLSVCCP